MINGESANAQDARVEELWQRLDGTAKGYLDLAGLKKGLRKMDHRMLRSLKSFDVLPSLRLTRAQLSKTHHRSSRTS
jgi:hypothetical protein